MEVILTTYISIHLFLLNFCGKKHYIAASDITADDHSTPGNGPHGPYAWKDHSIDC